MGAVMRPTLFLLHALGMSAREWEGVTALLSDRFDCVAIDLPGFGDAAGDDRTDVEAMVDLLADRVWACAPRAWMVAGHSMGGKLATLLARRAEAGEEGLSGLAGVVLVAASPPSPEPMDEDRRAEMIGWFAEGSVTQAQAEEFVDANTAARLPDRERAQAVADVRRSSREAWLAWLERGSREDWSWPGEPLGTPALIVAGGEDGDLGEEAQRRLNAPLYARRRVEVVAGAAHLIPYERPERLAALIAEHWAQVEARALPEDWARMLASPRVSARTRAALIARLDAPADTRRTLSDTQMETLAALLDRVLPAAAERIDLASRLEERLSGPGDGWRFAALPPDAEAWRRGLDTLDALSGGFAGLDAAAQDKWLDKMADGAAGSVDADLLDGDGMRYWFEDVRAAAARVWMAHPAAMARVGYDGIANGGDGVRKQGFQRLGADDVEAWQPAPAGAEG